MVLTISEYLVLKVVIVPDLTRHILSYSKLKKKKKKIALYD